MHFSSIKIKKISEQVLQKKPVAGEKREQRGYRAAVLVYKGPATEWPHNNLKRAVLAGIGGINPGFWAEIFPGQRRFAGKRKPPQGAAEEMGKKG